MALCNFWDWIYRNSGTSKYLSRSLSFNTVGSLLCLLNFVDVLNGTSADFAWPFTYLNKNIVFGDLYGMSLRFVLLLWSCVLFLKSRTWLKNRQNTVYREWSRTGTRRAEPFSMLTISFHLQTTSSSTKYCYFHSIYISIFTRTLYSVVTMT